MPQQLPVTQHDFIPRHPLVPEESRVQQDLETFLSRPNDRSNPLPGFTVHMTASPPVTIPQDIPPMTIPQLPDPAPDPALDPAPAIQEPVIVRSNEPPPAKDSTECSVSPSQSQALPLQTLPSEDSDTKTLTVSTSHVALEQCTVSIHEYVVVVVV
jgi:hypothetical protein